MDIIEFLNIDSSRLNADLLVDIPLPDIDLGVLFDTCYTWLESEKEPDRL